MRWIFDDLNGRLIETDALTQVLGGTVKRSSYQPATKKSTDSRAKPPDFLRAASGGQAAVDGDDLAGQLSDAIRINMLESNFRPASNWITCSPCR